MPKKLRPQHEVLLHRLRSLGRGAAVSELAAGFDVTLRTLRRWLQELCELGLAEASGVNKGRRYRALDPLPAPGAAAPPARLGPADLRRRLVREIAADQAPWASARLLAAERARAHLPPDRREAFAAELMQLLKIMTPAEAQALGADPAAFARWRRRLRETDEQALAAVESVLK